MQWPNVRLVSVRRMLPPSRAWCRLSAAAHWLAVVCSFAVTAFAARCSEAAEKFQSHSPMRPLPQARPGQLADGPKKFVDARKGRDSHPGTAQQPYQTLRFALKQLQPGDTLYLREGIYFEHLAVTKSGTQERPITIASYPGELAVIDGSLRQFQEDPASAWQPYAGQDAAPGEFVSTQTFDEADARRIPNQFLPGCWEPMLGLEEERPLALGHFADSLIPLHGYRIAADLRAKNELWIGNKNDMRDVGIYAGPGLWFNRETGRIHVRLAPHQLAGLGERAYRGETDPRQLPLIVSVGFGEEVARLTGVKHVRLHDLVFRGATGSPMLHVYGAQDIELDHVTVFGGFPALLLNASQKVRVQNSAFRGLAAPWISRAHMKYRGTASYQIVLQNNQPLNSDIEFDHCEFTDDHDFAFLRYATNLRFHHNFVDNFNDDGLETGPKLRSHSLFVSQNRIGRCLIPLTQHELFKDESPIEHDAASGLYFYRNVVDLRGGTYKGPPSQPDLTGEFLTHEGHVVGDHGSPIWSVMRIYHNTFLRRTPVFRDYYLFGLGAQGARNSEREVFNNIFLQIEKVPGVGFAGISKAERIREGGNLLWSPVDGPQLKGDPFAKFRSTALFRDSREFYAPGWSSQDRVADPRFVSSPTATGLGCDLRLQAGSPAINSGEKLPEHWPDLLRAMDDGAPDIGAMPFESPVWGVGIDGRLPLFGE